MEVLFQSSTKCVFLLVLFMVTNASDLSDQSFESKSEGFISKGSMNHRIMTDTGDMNTERGDQESQTNMTRLTKRNLLALQNMIEKNSVTLENIWSLMPRWIELMRSDARKHHTEIEKHSAVLDRVEKEIQKHHVEVNFKSIFEKVDNLEKHMVKRADLQSIQNNILYSIQTQLKPSGPSSEYTKAEESVKYQVTKEHLLTYLKSISASRIISGIHFEYPLSSGNLIYDMTGIHPGIWSATMSNRLDLMLQWGSFIDEAISQWNNHSLVSLQWWPCPPILTGSCEHVDLFRQVSTTEWNDLVTDGGRLNKLWKIRLNSTIVPFLKRLESAGVVVIFDPLPEMNSRGLWWARSRDAISGNRRLYQITHDYITKEHNLNSIIWKWSVRHYDGLQTYMEQLWPGEGYVDVSSVMMWNTKEPSTLVYEKMQVIVGDKPMSMVLMNAVPTAELFKRQPRWTWFTVVAIFLKKPEWNNVTTVKAAFKNPSVINRDGMDIFRKTNYALKGIATASSFESVDVKEEKAIDGNNATRWSSEISDPQWLQIDLGQLRFVKMIKIFWETAFATGYQIQISEDKMTWTIAHEEYYGAGGLKEISINLAMLSRYVKIFGFESLSGYGYSISELEVY